MKITRIVLYVAIMFSAFVYGQNFEGSLLYSVDFTLSEKAIAKGMTREMIEERLKKNKEALSPVQYWYKGSNYLRKLVDIGHTGIYLGTTNTLYNQKVGENTITAIDASVDMETDVYHKPPSVEIADTDVVILGKKCKKVVVIWSNNVYEYYFSPGYLPMNPDLYKNYNLNMWHKYLSLAKALPLRMVKGSTDGSVQITMDLIEVKETKVDAGLFTLPKMALDKELSEHLPKNQQIYKKI